MIDQVRDLSSYIEPCDHQVVEFSDAVTIHNGMIQLPIELVSIYDNNIWLTRQADFIIIDHLSIYNGFLGRPFVREFRAT